GHHPTQTHTLSLHDALPILATFTPDHPRLVELKAQIREAHQRMDREITNVVRKIESDFGAARAKEEALQAEVERQQQAALNMKEDRKSTRLNSSHDQISYAV